MTGNKYLSLILKFLQRKGIGLLKVKNHSTPKQNKGKSIGSHKIPWFQ